MEPRLPAALVTALTALSLLTLVLAPASALSAAAPTSPAPVSAASVALPSEVELVSGQVTLSIDALAPEVIHDGEDLLVTGTIANGTDETLSGSSLVVQIQEGTEVTFETLSLWLANERDTSLSSPSTTRLPQLQPGQTSSFSVTVNSENLPLSARDQWGPRGVQVALTDGGATVAEDRSIIVWDSSSSVDAARVTTVIPVTASAEELMVLTLPASAADDSSAAEVTVTEVQQRVQALLELAGDGVVLAVDPALLEALGVDAGSFQGDLASSTPPDTTGTATAPSTPHTGQPSGPSPAAASPSAAPTADPSATPSGSSSAPTAPASLTAALTRAIANGDVATLPWDDADTAALSHLGETNLLTTSVQRSQSSAVAGAGADPTLAWPVSSQLDAQTLEALPDSVTTIVAPVGSVPVTQDLTYTPSGTTTIGSRTILVPDEPASLTLAGQLPEPLDDQELSDLDTRQLLRARTAIFTRQAPSVGRDLVITLDRASAAAVEPEVLAQRLAALRDTSWVTAQDLETLRSRTVEKGGTGETGSARSSASPDPSGSGSRDSGDVARTDPPEQVSDSDEITSGILSEAYRSGGRLDSIASVLSDPRAALGRASDLASIVSSASWRSNPQARRAYLDSAVAAGDSVVDALSAAPSSTINIISSEADLPVRIVSTLSQEATLQVRLVSDSQRLQMPDSVTVTVPARSQVTTTVPVTAVGSGDVDLTIEVLADDGTAVGTPTTVHMQVRAAWESVGTWVVGGVLALVLVSGVTRTVRRGRRTVTPTIPAPAQEKA
ncbi:DUF6049 family protein [Actinomyces lilanjuaniae]|uniref:DUF6049 family protein n=1 Tax=Actinomyces lilanjuaniae TaxID=2321394 RepID=UPI0013C4A69D|nr:DUF6049 family protein [Actinomyces lilanjuaniae]